MINIGKCLTSVAALGLMAAPVMASAADVDGVRSSAPVEDSENLSGGLLLAGFAAALVAVVVIVSDDDEPASP